MAKLKRACDCCGKQKVFKKGKKCGAKCKAGHYICKKCHSKGFIWSMINILLLEVDILPTKKKKCPLCKEKLLVIKKVDLI